MIHVVGLGGVGFWLALGLTRHVGSTNLHCWDDDTLAGGTGSARLPWGPDTTKKTDLLIGHLRMVYGDTSVPQVSERRFSGLLGVEQGDIVVDCTDMPLEARRRMWNCARKRGAKLLRVSYDGRGSVVVVSTGLPLAAPPEGGYAAVPSLALSLAAGGLGAEVVKRYIDTPKESFTIALSLQEAMQE